MEVCEVEARIQVGIHHEFPQGLLCLAPSCRDGAQVRYRVTFITFAKVDSVTLEGNKIVSLMINKRKKRKKEMNEGRRSTLVKGGRHRSTAYRLSLNERKKEMNEGRKGTPA
jgi:hypothetical protein